MTIDASIPLRSWQPADIMGNYLKGMQARAIGEEAQWKREDRGREQEARSRLSDLLIAQDHMRSAGSYGDAPGGAPLPTGNPAETGGAAPGGLAGLVAGAQAPGPMTEAGATTAGQPNGDVEGMRREAMKRGYDAAWQALVQADPEGALKVRKSQFGSMKDEVELIGTLATGAVDQPTYEAALARAEQYGLDVSNVPREFNPEMVRGLTLQAAGAAQALSAIRQDKRLQWDIEDDVNDNERADRALTARINYQDERLEDFDAAEQGREDRANKPKPSAGAKAPASEGALYADIMRRWTKGEPVNNREKEFAQKFEQRKGRKSGGAKGSGYTAKPAADLIGPVYKKGNQRIQMSKSKGGYVDVSTGQLVK